MDDKTLITTEREREKYPESISIQKEMENRYR
jgi:hypothetical protein